MELATDDQMWPTPCRQHPYCIECADAVRLADMGCLACVEIDAAKGTDAVAALAALNKQAAALQKLLQDETNAIVAAASARAARVATAIDAARKPLAAAASVQEVFGFRKPGPAGRTSAPFPIVYCEEPDAAASESATGLKRMLSNMLQPRIFPECVLQVGADTPALFCEPSLAFPVTCLRFTVRVIDGPPAALCVGMKLLKVRVAETARRCELTAIDDGCVQIALDVARNTYVPGTTTVQVCLRNASGAPVAEFQTQFVKPRVASHLLPPLTSKDARVVC